MAMTLRLTPEQDRALTLLAQVSGTSKQEAAARAIVSTAARTLADEEVRQLAISMLDDVAATAEILKPHRAETGPHPLGRRPQA
ncbi:CopG family transcriptional regulator [Corynebacterium sp. SCR221107]|uniref:CopG family transcriptional regulator n=1 Tax=Corynebacterium sp. SCR221107 TaxID=3017361 RepID=UPI0022EC655F|nr:CopG family transcriptional regulator [Corynebacterium sp. SCR221107]WBT08803.1 CopG family transcriptional regulator [Corynebacterium sp. SCR221107]